MSTLYLVRLPVDPLALAAYAVAEGVDDDDRGYATHLALRRRFGAAAPQPFRLMDEQWLLGYAADIEALHEAARLPPADARLERIFGEPESREMPEVWHVGQRLGFEVRVRPVIRYGKRVRASRAAEGKLDAGERDAFLVALEDHASSEPLDRHRVYHDWLVRRLEGVACLEQVDIRLMRRLRTRRSAHKGERPNSVEGYDVVFGGTLEVVEPECFARLLERGVGRHTAFGFGMLLLKPPGSG